MVDSLCTLHAVVLCQSWLFKVDRLSLQFGAVLNGIVSKPAKYGSYRAHLLTLGSRSINWIWSKSFVRT